LGSRQQQDHQQPRGQAVYTAKADPRNERQDFSKDDMRLILTECRKARNPVVRITNLMAAFSGARLAEIVEANTLDFRTEGEHLVFHVRLENRAPTETLKTEDSARRFPLHSAIRDEVAAYIKGLPFNSPLFPHVTVDRDGKRGKNAGNTIVLWLRGIGIKDSREVFHSHRHTFKTACRGKIDREIRNYITGHSSGDVASEYGDYPLRSWRLRLRSRRSRRSVASHETESRGVHLLDGHFVCKVVLDTPSAIQRAIVTHSVIVVVPTSARPV
jgi:integrase